MLLLLEFMHPMWTACSHYLPPTTLKSTKVSRRLLQINPMLACREFAPGVMVGVKSFELVPPYSYCHLALFVPYYNASV
jgi:hypothetical protein